VGTFVRRAARDQHMPGWRIAPGYSDPPPTNLPAQRPRALGGPSAAPPTIPADGPASPPLPVDHSGAASSPQLPGDEPSGLIVPSWIRSARGTRHEASSGTDLTPMRAGTSAETPGGESLWFPPSTEPTLARAQPDLPPAAGPQPLLEERQPPAPADGPRRFVRPRDRGLQRSISAFEPISVAEASAFAARFAADYSSWDEDDPTRRAEVLRGYLADPRTATLGWSGSGRQRAEAGLPGRTLWTSENTIVVEVTQRVTAYQRYGDRPEPVEPRGRMELPANAVGPSCAPAPDDDDWLAVGSYWEQLAVPVSRDRSGRLVIDIGTPPDHDDS
jgi:hypothetical protein